MVKHNKTHVKVICYHEYFAKDFSLRRHANDFRFIFYNMAMYNICLFPLSIDRSIHGQYKRRDVQ